MTVEVKLFATLRKYLPKDSDGKSTSVKLKAGATVADLLKALKIPSSAAQLVLVDGQHVKERDRVIEGDCSVSIFPAMAGGRDAS